VCFSAEADFVSGAVIGAIGIATLTQVERPREIPLAILPLAFALHQIAEGFVWRDLDAGANHSTGVAVYLYLAFAWVGYGLTPAQHIFRFGNPAYLIGIALCALAALLAIHVLRRGRFALLLDERLSSPLEHRLRMVLLAPLFIFYGIALLEVWMERPYGRGALALLLIPVLVFVGWRPWRSSWCGTRANSR